MSGLRRGRPAPFFVLALTFLGDTSRGWAAGVQMETWW